MSNKDAILTYKKFGIDVNKAMEIVKEIPISIHCWQGDDITGFEHHQTALSGGIQVTGDYPGKARNFEELKDDIRQAIKYIPGKKRINLHAIYAVTEGFIERDALKPEHFDKWIEFALENNLKIDFNPTFFSHQMVKNNLTLSSPDSEVRKFWIRHGKACRNIAAYIGKKQQSPCLFNVWIPDGMKDVPADRLGPRLRLKESLDEIFSDHFDSAHIIDSIESKVFGIGLESYTVGSHEFYMNYAKEKNIQCLLDSGHYHPTENVADKISSLIPFNKFIAFHITRAVRWDSDHVVLFDDTTREIAREIMATGKPERFLIGLDYFDATINRVASWIIGTRNFQKALLYAALMPFDQMKSLQDNADFTALLVLQEEMKTMPFSSVWEAYCEQQNIISDFQWYEEIKIYEKNILSKRR